MFNLDPKGALVSLFLATALFFLVRKKSVQEGVLFFSDLSSLKGNVTNKKGFYGKWLKPAMLIATGLFLVAITDPYIKSYTSAKQKKAFSPNDGIGIYLVLDQSGSMSAPLSLLMKSAKREAKIELLKEKSEQFVISRPHDLIGLVAFARFPTILSPLTNNHQMIIEQLKSLQVIKDKSQDGTAIGYALFKTANLIVSTQELYRKEGSQLNAVIILVSDGLQDPNPLDSGHAYRAMEMEEAAEFAKQHGIKIYIINIEPRLKEKKFEPNLKQMQRVSQMTGGQFFLADENKGVEQIFQDLNAIEKSKISVQDMGQEYEKIALFPYFVILGLGIAFTVFLLQNTFFRQVP